MRTEGKLQISNQAEIGIGHTADVTGQQFEPINPDTAANIGLKRKYTTPAAPDPRTRAKRWEATNTYNGHIRRP